MSEEKKKRGTPAPFDTLGDGVYACDRTIAAGINVSRPTLWRWVVEGKFPKPYKISERTTRWNVGEVRAFIQSKREA